MRKFINLSTQPCTTSLLKFERALNLEEENKLIEVGFEYVRYSEKGDVAIYRKRK